MNPTAAFNWDQPWTPRYAALEMCGPTRMLPPALRCLVQDFRDYSWINFGLPTAVEELENLAKSFGISRYMFRKNWETVKQFFQISGEKLVFAADEHHRRSVPEVTRNYQEMGKKGAKTRWSKGRPGQSEIPFSDSDKTIAQMAPSYVEVEVEVEAKSELSIGVPASSATPQPPKAAAAAPAPITELEREAIAIRAAELGLHAPDRKTSEAIIRRFPTIDIAKYPRFPNQNSPGLWLHKTPLDMRLEIARQDTTSAPRKLTRAEEADEQLRAIGRELDRKVAQA
jgi:hypothetical protein